MRSVTLIHSWIALYAILELDKEITRWSTKFFLFFSFSPFLLFRIFHSLATQPEPCIRTVLLWGHSNAFSWWKGRARHSGFKVWNPSFHARLKQPYLNFSSFVVGLHPGRGKKKGEKKKKQPCNKLTSSGWISFLPPPTGIGDPPAAAALGPPPQAAGPAGPACAPWPHGWRRGRSALLGKDPGSALGVGDTLHWGAVRDGGFATRNLLLESRGLWFAVLQPRKKQTQLESCAAIDSAIGDNPKWELFTCYV